jgi:D-methionine transport system substrate-binding protein
MKKKILSIGLVTFLLISVLALSSCGGKKSGSVTIAVPNDTTNEARALLLLQDNGYIKLKDGAGITATIRDIEDTNGIEFKEVEAAQIPNTLQDVDFGVINSNYAIDAGLNPIKDSLIREGNDAKYANIIAVKEGNENSDKIKALVAAVSSKKVVDYIDEKYQGSILSVVDDPTDGFDPDVNYDALKGETITVAASPAPHADILAVAKDILAEKDINLDIKEFTDYVQPNKVVDSGEVDANYFQHKVYMDDFNKENGTKVVSCGGIHNEPMGLYPGKSDSLDKIEKLK